MGGVRTFRPLLGQEEPTTDLTPRCRMRCDPMDHAMGFGSWGRKEHVAIDEANGTYSKKEDNLPQHASYSAGSSPIPDFLEPL